MHIPDGFLSPAVWAPLDLASLAAVGAVARRARQDVNDSSAPLLGVLGAFVFAAQMINFPVGVGTSGHLVGSALLAATLGPAAASIVMTAILVIQALIFQDGGILALGANVLNMALAGVLAGYLPIELTARTRFRGAGIFLGGVASVFLAACLALVELRISGVPMGRAVTGLSIGMFLISGLIEGGITVAVVGALDRLHPGRIRRPETSAGSSLELLAGAAVLLAAVGVLFASSAPDGLEKLIEDLGISRQAHNLFTTPFTDYESRLFESAWLRKATAGLAGLAVIYAVCLAISRCLTLRRDRAEVPGRP